MRSEGRVDVTAYDRPVLHQGRDVREEKRRNKCRRDWKQGEFAAGSANETVDITVGVDKTSSDRAGSVDDNCVDECARARNFQRGDGAVRGALEDVRAVFIKVQSHDHPLRGYENRGEKAWNVERRDGAVVVAYETVHCKGRIKVTAHDLTRRIDTAGRSEL